MGKAIGIDLGTTNSVAAFKEAQVEVITAEDNTPPDRKLTRSAVAYEQGKHLVGEKAYNQLRADPENTIMSIKRLMGRGFGDSAVQKQKSEFSYKITQPTQGTENGIAVWLGGKEYQPEDISAEILKKVVQNAQAYRQAIGKPEVINQAVITIPAYFNDKQRQATRTAALKAGLTPLELLPEPTAAAISYGYSPDSTDVKTILVYDFGGGTFDASLITAAGTQFIENGKAGDLWLGGDDIDSRMIKFVKQQVAQTEGLTDIDDLINKMPHYQRVRFLADLKMGVERAKVELSSAAKAQIAPSTPLIDELGLAIPVEVEFTRKQFEAMITELVERSIKICHEALRLSEYPADEVDVVLLVGGSSQIPLVQRQVRQAFGANKVVVHPRPMYAVAEGAAIVAANLVDKVATVSRDYFIHLESEPRYKVISQGDILPVTTSHTFKTVADGQRLVHFKFFSPDQVSADLDKIQQDDPIGEMWLGLDQHYPRGTEVMVNLVLDEKNNDLKFRATLKNDPSVTVSCTFSRGRSDEKTYKELQQTIEDLNAQDLTALGVEEALKLAVPVVQAANEIIDRKTGDERIDMRDRAQENLKKFQVSMSKERLEAEYLVSECKRLVELCGSLIPQPQQKRLQELAQQLEKAIKDSNESQMQSLLEDAEREIRNLPDEVKMIRACFLAVGSAYAVAPTQASAMADKVHRMINALEKHDGYEADRLWQELRPEVSRWLDEKLPSNSIVTGLTR